MTLKEMLEKRAKLIHDARQIIDKAGEEKRDLSAEERTQSDQMIADAEQLSTTISERQDTDRRSDALTALEERLDDPETNPGNSGQPGGDNNQRSDNNSLEMEFRGETLRFEHGTNEHRRSTDGYCGAFGSYLARGAAGLRGEETRALQADSDPDGGFMVPPQFVANLIKFVDDLVYVRQRATVLPLLNGDSVGFPSLDADADDAEWTSELKTGTEDAGLKMGLRELHPHALVKQVKVSNKLLRIAALDPARLVLERLGYKIGVTEEKGFYVGTGAGQPLGVFVASNQGIPTGRDVSAGNTPTEIRFDGLIESKYSVKSQYWRNASWTFHRDAVKQLVKLKDGDGQYLWRNSIRDGEPDRLLGHPIDISEFAPNTFTTGQYVGLFGDWSHYWIADSLKMSIQRLVELFALTNQVGFLERQETDGMPTLGEAFARVQLA